MAEGGEEARGVCRERGCNDAAGRGKDRGRGHKRPARRDARGDAPSFVSFRELLSTSLPLLLFLSSPPTADPVSTPCETDPCRYLPFSFVRADDRDILRESADVAWSHPRDPARFENAGWRVCEKPAPLTLARRVRRTRHCRTATS